MINNITINGIAYELIDNPDKLTLSCDKCDLLYFCQKELKFADVCDHVNSNNYYKTIKQ